MSRASSIGHKPDAPPEPVAVDEPGAGLGLQLGSRASRPSVEYARVTRSKSFVLPSPVDLLGPDGEPLPEDAPGSPPATPATAGPRRSGLVSPPRTRDRMSRPGALAPVDENNTDASAASLSLLGTSYASTSTASLPSVSGSSKAASTASPRQRRETRRAWDEAATSSLASHASQGSADGASSTTATGIDEDGDRAGGKLTNISRSSGARYSGVEAAKLSKPEKFHVRSRVIIHK